MIICFEGPSAVGKTSMCQLLQEDFQIVAEVNELFEKEEGVGKFWYFERQIDRYALCKNSKVNSILDGDVFQPLWYNWIYGGASGLQSFEETKHFYSKAIREGRIRFPDLYVIFQSNLEVLRKRKEGDRTRKRRNFEKHLNMISLQQKYFSFLKTHTEIEIVYIENQNQEKTRTKILSYIESKAEKNIGDAINYKIITNWLEQQTRR